MSKRDYYFLAMLLCLALALIAEDKHPVMSRIFAIITIGYGFLSEFAQKKEIPPS